MPMDLREHLRTAAVAIRHWLVATLYDALAVGALWLVGLLILRVPWAPVWALLGALFQFVPQFGIMLALIAPALAALFSGGFDRFLYVLMLYAVIVVADGLLLQPLFMKRRARVPFWASLTAPLVLGFFFSFWGVLLAPPLLAVLFAFRERARNRRAQHPDLPAPESGE